MNHDYQTGRGQPEPVTVTVTGRSKPVTVAQGCAAHSGLLLIGPGYSRHFGSAFKVQSKARARVRERRGVTE